jgi:subtilisin family serine protease
LFHGAFTYRFQPRIVFELAVSELRVFLADQSGMSGQFAAERCGLFSLRPEEFQLTAIRFRHGLRLQSLHEMTNKEDLTMSLNGVAVPVRAWQLSLALLLLLSPQWLLAQTPTQATITASTTGSVLSAPGLQATGSAPSQVIVRFQPGAAAQPLPGTGRARALSQSLNLHVMDLPPGLTVSQAVARYKNNPNVVYAEPDYIVQADTDPTDPKWAQQWDMMQISAPAAWDTQTNAGSVVVAIVDTGLNFTHEDLAANLWTNPADGVSHGFNCIGGTCVAGAAATDDHGHGTHVAGTIGAVANNGKGIAGINWNVKIAAFKFLNSAGSGNISDAVAAFVKIKELIQQNVPIRVTNNSWGRWGV